MRCGHNTCASHRINLHPIQIWSPRFLVAVRGVGRGVLPRRRRRMGGQARRRYLRGRSCPGCPLLPARRRFPWPTGCIKPGRKAATRPATLTDTPAERSPAEVDPGYLMCRHGYAVDDSYVENFGTAREAALVNERLPTKEIGRQSCSLVSIPFSPAHYLRLCFRVLTASRAVKAATSMPEAISRLTEPRAQPEPEPEPQPPPPIIDQFITSTPILSVNPTNQGGPVRWGGAGRSDRPYNWGGVGMYCENPAVRCR
jgi:hypothetical protein